MPWPQHPPRDFGNERLSEACACFGHVHRRSEESQDSPAGKCAGLKNKQTCLWILTLRLPAGQGCAMAYSSPSEI